MNVDLRLSVETPQYPSSDNPGEIRRRRRLSRLRFGADRALAVPTAMPTAPVSGESVFSPRLMASIAYVASPIPCLVSLEVVEALRPALRQRSNVTVMRIEAVVDMAEEAARTVKPGASSKKYSANKPIGPIVAVRSTVIRGIVEVSVRTHGSHSDVYADGNLGLRRRCTAQKGNCESCESECTDFEHDSSFIRSEFSTWTTKGQHNTRDQ